MPNIQNLRWDHEHCSRVSTEYWNKVKRPLEEEFWSFVEKRGPDECWPWTGFRHYKGYGIFSYRGKKFTASRVAYELSHGPLNGLWALHKCDNPPCVNPNHLFAGTPKDNVSDCIRKGRKIVLRGENHGQAKYSDAFVQTVCQAYQQRTVTTDELNKQFGLPPLYIYKILRRGGVAADRVHKKLFRKPRSDKRPKRERPARNKITRQIVEEIRMDYASGAFTQKEIAAKYKLAQCHISRILSGKRWA